jgi:hypothetical protein
MENINNDHINLIFNTSISTVSNFVKTTNLISIHHDKDPFFAFVRLNFSTKSDLIIGFSCDYIHRKFYTDYLIKAHFPALSLLEIHHICTEASRRLFILSSENIKNMTNIIKNT